MSQQEQQGGAVSHPHVMAQKHMDPFLFSFSNRFDEEDRKGGISQVEG